MALGLNRALVRGDDPSHKTQPQPQSLGLARFGVANPVKAVKDVGQVGYPPGYRRRYRPTTRRTQPGASSAASRTFTAPPRGRVLNRIETRFEIRRSICVPIH